MYDCICTFVSGLCVSRSVIILQLSTRSWSLVGRTGGSHPGKGSTVPVCVKKYGSLGQMEWCQCNYSLRHRSRVSLFPSLSFSFLSKSIDLLVSPGYKVPGRGEKRGRNWDWGLVSDCTVVGLLYVVRFPSWLSGNRYKDVEKGFGTRSGLRTLDPSCSARFSSPFISEFSGLNTFVY